MDAQALLTPDAVADAMGTPLAHVPDQDRTATPSYARHFADVFIDVFAGLGIRPDRYYWMSEIYPTGDMDPFIRTALDRAAIVRDIYRRVANVQHPDAWHPLSVICENCGKIGTTIVTDWDGERRHLRVPRAPRRLGDAAAATPGRIAPFGGRAKLPWNLEWAAQWSLFGVTIEPCGKDLSTAGGSRDRSDAIAREVFEREPPLNVPYEFINIGGKKMSTSKGRGAAAHEIVEVIPPEQLRFFFLRPRPNHAVEFDPEGTDAIPRLFDEFDRFAAATAGREVKGELAPGYDATFRYSLLDPDADVAGGGGAHSGRRSPTSRSSSRSRTSTSQRGSTARRGRRSTTRERRILDERVAAARRWLEAYAPERARLTVKRDVLPAEAARARRRPAGLSSPRWRRSPRSVDRIRARPGRTRSSRPQPSPDLEPRAAFTALYLAFLGRPNGPASRLAPGQPGAGVRDRPAARRERERRGRRRSSVSVGLQRLRDDADAIRKGATDKGEDPATVDRAIALDERRRALLGEGDRLKAERNAASKQIGEAIKSGASPNGPEVADLKAASTAAGERIAAVDGELATVEAEVEDLLLRIPNPADPDVPIGGEESNVTVRTWGEQLPVEQPLEGEVGADAPAAGATWTRKPHWDIAEALDIIDNARGAKIAGSGFPVYKGAGSALQRALINWFLDVHTRENGMTEIWPPAVVNTASATGTGQIPDKEDQMYVVTRDELYLVPTAEVPVTNLHRDEILEAADLPIRYAAYSPCFRREAGAAGKDTRGILRVHQFDKVEMVLFEKPADSDAALEWMTERAEILLQRLGLAYRVLLMATRDMGFTQAKKYDLEVWAPGVERWLEVSSCSNFRDFQARRMAIRHRPEPGAKPELVHTLNGSGLALARVVAAILETYQQFDGSVAVPEVLRPAMGTDWIHAPAQ